MPGDEFELTVIIPTYNRGDVIVKCLDALCSQTLPARSFEVIVSDDGSEDDTREKTENFIKNGSIKIRYLRQSNQGANVARNHAILKSKGRILLIINDDTIATPPMLEEHQRTHQKYPEENVAVLGKVTYSQELPYSPFAKLHLDSEYGLWKGQVDLDWCAFYTCNISVKKSFLMKYGLFEAKIRGGVEDFELGERLSHHGLKVIYNPGALGYHYHHFREEDFLGMAEREGKARAVWYKKSPHLKKELASIGFYVTSPLPKRIKSAIGDLLINRRTFPFLLALARFFIKNRERIALILYRKIYQSIHRAAIRKELKT